MTFAIETRGLGKAWRTFASRRKRLAEVATLLRRLLAAMP